MKQHTLYSREQNDSPLSKVQQLPKELQGYEQLVTFLVDQLKGDLRDQLFGDFDARIATVEESIREMKERFAEIQEESITQNFVLEKLGEGQRLKAIRDTGKRQMVLAIDPEASEDILRNRVANWAGKLGTWKAQICDRPKNLQKVAQQFGPDVITFVNAGSEVEELDKAQTTAHLIDANTPALLQLYDMKFILKMEHGPLKNATMKIYRRAFGFTNFAGRIAVVQEQADAEKAKAKADKEKAKKVLC